MTDCLFCKFITKEIPKEFTYEDEYVIVFPDIHPLRKVHLLIIPKEHVADLDAVENPELFEHVFAVVQKMIKEQNLKGKGYRVVINGGGAQMIDHLHIHLMGPMKNTAAMG